MTIYSYALWTKGPEPEMTRCGEFVIDEADNLQIRRVAFRYTDVYLNKPWAYPLDPGKLPLVHADFEFDADGKNLPGFIDDLMPDQWGRNLLARYLHSVAELDFDPHSQCQVLNHLPQAFVGALKATPLTKDTAAVPSPSSLGVPVDALEELGDPDEALRVEPDSDLQRYGVARLAQGSSVGGARPKVLCFDDTSAYIAKFRRDNDPFDMVGAEAACLEMLRQAGFNAPKASISDVGGGRHALMVERFDLGDGQARHHMMTANALLKRQSGCEDPAFGDYTDLVDLIRRYSVAPASDFRQLFAQLLFNQHLNNRDDHLRNFSFLNGPDGFRLSPAYDIVPTPIAGTYAALAYRGSTVLPDCDCAADAARVFHLTRNEALMISRRVKDVMSEWRSFFRSQAVTDQDLEKLRHALRDPG